MAAGHRTGEGEGRTLATSLSAARRRAAEEERVIPNGPACRDTDRVVCAPENGRAKRLTMPGRRCTAGTLCRTTSSRSAATGIGAAATGTKAGV